MGFGPSNFQFGQGGLRPPMMGNPQMWPQNMQPPQGGPPMNMPRPQWGGHQFGRGFGGNPQPYNMQQMQPQMPQMSQPQMQPQQMPQQQMSMPMPQAAPEQPMAIPTTAQPSQAMPPQQGFTSAMPMQSAPMPQLQPQQEFAAGGGLGAGTPYTTPPQSSPLPKGLIASPVAGRTDSIEVTAKPGSFIFPADVVSGLGQGNTLAGERILDSLLKGGPKMSKPMKPRSKGLRRFADGGATQEVPIIVAGGEYSVGPEEVIAVGGGDYDKGHKLLSNMVVGVRKQVINQLEKLPGPVR